MPRLENYDYAKTKDVLDEYVRPQECATADFPAGLDPEFVSKYVKDEVTAKFDLDQMTPAMAVMRFYGLDGQVDQALGFIQSGEKNVTDLRHTCVILETACELGSPSQQKTAVEHFDRLLAGKLAETDDGLEYLITTFFSLPPRTPAKPLQTRVKEIRERIERQGPENQLGRYLEYELRLLPWVLKEKNRKDWLLTMPAGPDRIRGWAEAYLMFNMETPFKWDKPAAFGLVRLARDEGDEATVEALRAVMNTIDPQKDRPETVEFRKTRGYKARAYFLETFDGETRRDAKASMGHQEDLIE